MDRSTESTDAFVEIRFGSDVHKTEVYKKSRCPQWNSEWFIFEVEDETLQDEPLELRVLDHDTYSAHDAIGKVYIDLNPLLTSSKDSPAVISGWFPIYDTMHGIRGDVSILVKIDLFSDFNKFRQSSCGVQFYCTAEVPYGYRLQFLHGFVEELVVNDDPEYQWIDKIRTPRASNEARQRLFSKMSGQLTRKIGLKVLEMGGSAVIGYNQCFDLEGESGIVIRGIGTAVTLAKISQLPPSPLGVSPLKDSPLPEDTIAPSSPPASATRSSTSPVKVTLPSLHRRSSDSDISNTPPKGSSLTGSSGSGSGTGSGTKTYAKSCLQQVSIELMEYPLITMKSFPPGFISHLGGVVSARSVKLLDKIHNPEEPETRDAWWMEIRTEIRSHMRAMGCHAVIGYSEHTSICDEIIILSALGTAAKVNLNTDMYQSVRPSPQQLLLTPADKVLQGDKEKEKDKKLFVDVNLANQVSSRIPCTARGESTDEWSPQQNCTSCHIPYKVNNAPFPINLTQCAVCRRKYVPDVLFSTIDPPSEIQTVGKGAFIQARVCRLKSSNNKVEADAKEIGDILPFMEYELHNQLMNKLKIRSMNGLFGLKLQITVGENMLIGMASATGAFLAALPPPPTPRLLGQVTSEEENVALLHLQKVLSEKVQKYRDQYQLNSIDFSSQPSPHSANTDDSDDDQSELELSAGNKDTFILQVDDMKDESLSAVIEDITPPTGMELCNTQIFPGYPQHSMMYNLQMFTQVYRQEIELDQKLKSEFNKFVDRLLRKIFFKLRRMTPCCLCDLSFNVDIPEEDEIQIVVNGVCVAIDYSQSCDKYNSEMHGSSAGKNILKTAGVGASGDVDDMMFSMEEVTEGSGTSGGVKVTKVPKPEKVMKRLASTVFVKQPGRIDITPQAFIPGAKIVRYIGSYNFFFIRETTSNREMGGVCGFMHAFLAEVLSIVRANVASLGGNALVAYKMTQCVLMSNPHKNQCQCLINVSGDAVCTSKDGDITAIVVPESARKHSDSPSYTPSSVFKETQQPQTVAQT